MAELNVVIPTHNRAGQLRDCLEAIGRQTQPTDDFDVTVVIDGSTDGTAEMLAALSTPYSMAVIRQSRSGQQVARNRGAAAGSGRYCLFLDDDISPAPGLIAAHLRLLRANPNVVGLGALPMTLDPDADWFARGFAEQWNEHYASLDAGRLPTWLDCYGANLSVARAAFDQVGGFAPDMRSSHDIELGYRLHHNGLSFVYLPDAVGIHAEEKTGGELSAMLMRHGRAAVELYRRHPGVLADLLGVFGRPDRRTLLRRALLLLRMRPTSLHRLLRPLVRDLTQQRRWTRFLTAYSYWYGIRRAISSSDVWRRLTYGVPILLYHALGTSQEPPSRFVLPTRRFARQMAWLRLAGYRVISLEELVRCRREFRLPPARSVVITFDDGYADNLHLALPILRRHGFHATVFVVSGCIGGCNEWSRRKELARRPLMSWADLETLDRAGIGIGAHTRTHPLLPTLDDQVVKDEVEGSRRDLEDRLGKPVKLFAYPYGAYDERIRAMARGAGFLASCGTESRLNLPGTDLHALDRTEMRGTDSLLYFLVGILFGDPMLVFRRRVGPRGEIDDSPDPALQ